MPNSALRSRGRPLIEPVEQRLLYSADPAPLVAAGEAAAALVQVVQPAATVAPAHASADAQATQASRHELVVIDAAVPDAGALFADLQAQQQAGRQLSLLLLQPGQDGIAAISDALASADRPFDAVHLVGHGEDGTLRLGDTTLDIATLRLRADAIAGWSAGLSAGADILLYGCDTGAGTAGAQLVDGLAALTGADIAASTDATGAAALGGNWTLERTAGAVEHGVVFDAAVTAGWTHLLGPAVSSDAGAVPSAAAAPLVDPQELASASSGKQVAFDASGNAVAVWESNDNSTITVYAQRYDRSGAVLGPLLAVATTASGHGQAEPTVAFDKAGRFAVAWTTWNGSDTDIHASFYDPSGNVLASDVPVQSGSVEASGLLVALANDRSGAQTQASIASTGEDQFVITFTSAGLVTDLNSLLTSDDAIVAATFDGSGRRTGSNGINSNDVVVSDSAPSGNAGRSSVASAGDGSYVVVWEQHTSAGNMEVRGYRLGSVADPMSGTAFTVAADAGIDARAPDVSVADDGRFVVIWTRADGLTTDVLARGYGADLSTTVAAFVINEATGTAHGDASVAIDRARDDFFVAYQSNTQDGSGESIYMRRFGSTGNLIDSAELPGTPGHTGGDQLNPSVAYNGSTGLLIYQDGGSSQVRLTRTAFPAGGRVTADGGGTATTEAGGAVRLVVQLDAPPELGQTVTVSFDTSNALEARVDGTATLTFDGSNWSLPQAVTIRGVDDHVVDGTVTYQATWSVASGDSGYSGTGSIDLTNTDDDVPSVALTLDTLDSETSEGGDSAVLTVALGTIPTGNVRLLLTIDDAAGGTHEGSFASSPITRVAQTFVDFAAGTTNPQTVTIFGWNDFVNDGTSRYTVTATVVAPDGAGGGTTDTAYQGLGATVSGALTNVPVANLAPTLTAPATRQDVLSGGSIVFGDANGNAIHVGDPDAGDQPLALTIDAGSGTVNLTIGGATVLVDGVAPIGPVISFTGAATLTASRGALDAMLNGMTYDAGTIPGNMQNRTLTLSLDDQGNTGTGGALTASASISIRVTQAAILTPGQAMASMAVPTTSIEGTEDTVLPISTITLSNPGNGGNPNLTLDLVIEGGTATLPDATDSGTNHLTLTDRLNRLESAIAQLQFMPDADRAAQASILITLTDTSNAASNQSQVLINLAAVNDAPTLIVPSMQTIAEDGTVTFDSNTRRITVGDVDVDGATGNFTVRLDSSTLHGTLDFGAIGAATLTPIAGTTAAFTQATLSGTLDQLNAALATLTFTPEPDYSDTTGTTAGFDISVEDNGNVDAVSATSLSASGSVRIAITPVNDAPTISLPPSVTIAEDSGPLSSAGRLSIADIDADGATLQVTLTATSGNLSVGTLPAGVTRVSGTGPAASIALRGSAADLNTVLATLTYTPKADFNGAASVRVDVSDNGNSGAGGTRTATATMAITVTPVNDKPTVSQPTAATIAEDTVGWRVVGANNLPFVVGDPSDVAVGSANYTTNLDYRLDVVATDASGNRTGLLRIDPRLVPASTLFPTGTVADPVANTDVYEGSAIRVRATLASLNTLLQNMTFSPSPDFNGKVTIKVELYDRGYIGATASTGSTGTQSMTVTVTAVNDAPVVAVNTGITMQGGTSRTIDATLLSATDVEDTADKLVYTLRALPQFGELHRDGVVLAVGDRFTQADIAAGKLTYLQRAPGATADAFSFDLRDTAGAGPSGVRFAITIDSPLVVQNGSSGTGASGASSATTSSGSTSTSGSTSGTGTNSATTTTTTTTTSGSTGSTGGATTTVASGTASGTTAGSTSGNAGASATGAGGAAGAGSGPTGVASQSGSVQSAAEAAARNAAQAGVAATGTGNNSGTNVDAHAFAAGAAIDARAFSGAFGVGGSLFGSGTRGAGDSYGSGSWNYRSPLDAAAVESIQRVTMTTRMELGRSDFRQQLERVREQIGEHVTLDQGVVASSVAVSAGVSIGYVVWLLRGGLLLSSLLASVPAWRMIDPLPVFAGGATGPAPGDEDDSLQGLLKKASARLRGGIGGGGDGGHDGGHDSGHDGGDGFGDDALADNGGDIPELFERLHTPPSPSVKAGAQAPGVPA